MPIIKEEARGFKRHIPESKEPIEQDGPDTFDVVKSAFEKDNTFVKWAANGFSMGGDFLPKDGYNAFDDIEGYELYADAFIESESPEQTQAIKNKISREIDNNEILSNGGFTAVASTVAAGLTDPVYWPLMLVGVGEARVASSTWKAATRAAGIGGASEIPAEILKSQMEETRTLEESLVNIGGATILSGLLGAGVHKLVRENPELGIDAEKLLREAEQNFNSDEPNLSIGAAQTRQLSMEDLDLVGLGGLEKIPVSPLIRASNSPELATRDIVASLVETPLLSKGNVKGITTVPEGGAVETRVKRWDANLYEAIVSTKDNYKAYKKNNKGNKTLSYKDFRIEVGKAQSRGDNHSIPEVAAAAKSARALLIDPLKDAAIKAGMFPEDISVNTAPSYFTRVYLHKKIIRRRPEWNNIVNGWLKGLRSAAKVELDSRVAMGKNIPPSLKGEAGASDLEISQITDSITNKILGVSDGRLPFDVTIAERGPFKERTFQIPDELIEDFTERDVDIVWRQYKNTMAPDVEITRMFGDVTMKADIERINNSYTDKINKAETEKERYRLDKKRASDVRDVEAMRDRLRGTYKTPSDPNSFFVRVGRLLRDVNFMSLLGGMMPASIPDAAHIVAVNGLKPVSKGLKQLALSPKTFKLAIREAKKGAVGLDMVLNSRASSLADVTDAYQSGSRLERGVRAAGDVFSKLTLMSQWNAALKQFSGVITNDRIVSEAINLAGGKISKSNLARLAQSGIDEGLAKRISSQFEKYGDDGIIKIINGDKWDDIEALDALKSAVLKDVDRTIVTPSVGEKPLWTSSETGKMIFQFKTFAASAHHKIMLGDLQYKDAQALNGILLATALGTLTYGLKQYAAGQEISKNPNQLLVESLDRSGVWGYFWDVNNISAKMTNGELSLQSIIGADPVSRYASRNIIGAILGPSVGKVEDLRAISGSLSEDGELSESDIRRIRRFLPAQNLFYIRRLLDSLEEKVN